MVVYTKTQTHVNATISACDDGFACRKHAYGSPCPSRGGKRRSGRCGIGAPPTVRHVLQVPLALRLLWRRAGACDLGAAIRLGAGGGGGGGQSGIRGGAAVPRQ